MKPSVTIITPATIDKKEMIDRLQLMLSIQDYKGPTAWNINYDPVATIGAKRNALCLNSTGEIIIHADSDDLYAPDWVSRSVTELMDSKADLVGLANAYFFVTGGQLYEYNYNGGQPFVCGATMCYWRKTWVRNRFPDISNGEDAIFCANAGSVKYRDHKNGFAAIIHGKNTCSHLAIQMRIKQMAPSQEKVPLIEKYYPPMLPH